MAGFLCYDFPWLKGTERRRKALFLWPLIRRNRGEIPQTPPAFGKEWKQ